MKSTHREPHRLGAGATQLDEQLGVVAVVEQSAVGAEHTLPHWPQLCGRVRSASQPSSGRVEQCAKPETQAAAGTEQTPLWQVTPLAPTFTLGSAVQSCPQEPQFFASDLTSTHIVPQTSGKVPPQVNAHWAVPVVSEQTGAVAGQAMPQPPQLGEFARSASQPSSGRGEQWANPLAQALAGTEQTPSWQVTPVAPIATLGRVPQLCPQVPQFFTSFWRLTQAEPQMSLAAPEQLAVQAGPEAPTAHNGAEAGHVTLQAPQFCESARLVSQMSPGREVQWPNPGAHADGGTTQAPERHATPLALGLTLVRWVQSIAAGPQFWGSLSEVHGPDPQVPPLSAAASEPPESWRPVLQPVSTTASDRQIASEKRL